MRIKPISVVSFALLGSVTLVAIFVAVLCQSAGGTAQIKSDCVVESLPAQVPPLPSPTDCIVDELVLVDGSEVVGTREGWIGVYRDSHFDLVQAELETGAVTGLQKHRLGIFGEHEFVSFAVNQGVGVFDPSSVHQIDLGPTRSFYMSNGRDFDRTTYLSGNWYILLLPEPVRPDEDGFGRYVGRKSNGEEEAMVIDTSDLGGICPRYIEHPGAIPSAGWCVDVRDLFPPTPRPVQTPPPHQPCAPATAPSLDTSHRLELAITSSGFSPASFTVQAGQTYELDISDQDDGGHAAHGLKLRDDSSPCAVLIGPQSASTTFALSEPDRDVSFYDTERPTWQGVIHVVSATPTAQPSSVATSIQPPSPQATDFAAPTATAVGIVTPTPVVGGPPNFPTAATTSVTQP